MEKKHSLTDSSSRSKKENAKRTSWTSKLFGAYRRKRPPRPDETSPTPKSIQTRTRSLKAPKKPPHGGLRDSGLGTPRSPETQSLHTTEERAKFTGAITPMFIANQNAARNPAYQYKPQHDFIYDIILTTGHGNKQIGRRLLLDFETKDNIMAEDVQKRINTKLIPYDGPAIRVPGRSDVKPIGSIKVEWKLSQSRLSQISEFLVIRDSQFDVLLGTPAIKSSPVFRADPVVLTRLNESHEAK